MYRGSNDTSLPLAFWPKPISNFGLFKVTGFINSSRPLTMYPRLVPYRVLLSDIPFASRLRRVGYVICRASDHRVTTVACLRSLRLKVQPVCLTTLVISNNHHCDFVSHTSAFSWFSELSIMLSSCLPRPGARQHIQPITGWPWLFAPSYSLRPWGFLAVALPDVLGER